MMQDLKDDVMGDGKKSEDSIGAAVSHHVWRLGFVCISRFVCVWCFVSAFFFLTQPQHTLTYASHHDPTLAVPVYTGCAPSKL
jgi:hypothetical protein